MKKLIFLFLTFHFVCGELLLPLTYAQPVTQEWVRRYSGISSNGSTGLSIKLDSTGNVYVLTPVSTSSTLGDYCVTKYTQSGNFIWQAVYNTPENLADNSKAFAVSKTGYVYVTGSSGINFVDHILTVKFDSSGALQWAKTYNSEGPPNGANDIGLDKQGNIIITGSAVVNSDITLPLIIKYTPNGDTLWVRKFSQYSYGVNYKLVTDDSSNVYTTGYHKLTFMQENYLTLKYNSNGNLVWYSSYGLPPIGGAAQSIAIDTNRNMYIVGNMYTLYGSYSDNVLVKINNNGIMQWARTYTGIGGNHACSVTPKGVSSTLSGGLICYTTTSAIGNTSEFVTLAYNDSGDTIWTRRYPTGLGSGIPQNNPATLRFDRYYNIYVTGSSIFPSTGGDYVTIKYLPSGN